MASPSIRPHMLVADEQGNIYDHPDFLLLCRRGEEWSPPRLRFRKLKKRAVNN